MLLWLTSRRINLLRDQMRVLTLMDAPSPGQEKQPVSGGGGALGTCLDI